MGSLDALFKPRSIAVIGASESPSKPGGIVFTQLRAGGTGKFEVYPVNPRAETIQGVRAYTGVSELPEAVDLAVVAVGAASAVDAVEACAARGVGAAIVLAGGFGEAGEEGRGLEVRLTEICRRTGIRVLGPNTLGIQLPREGIDTVFVDHARFDACEDGAVIISQSGSVAVEALGSASSAGFQLAGFVGLGNQIDVSCAEAIDYFGRSAGVSALCVYLEHLDEGRRLLETARTAAEQTPVIVLKAGRTSAGAAAVASHTGRLAGSDRAVDGAFEAYGIRRALDDEELIDYARALTFASPPEGRRVAIVSPAGGFGVMCADAIADDTAETPLCLAELSEATESRLRQVLLPFASVRNPVDLTAGVDDDGFRSALDAVLADDGVDIVLVLAFFAPPGITDGLVDRIAEVAHNQRKPIVVLARGGAVSRVKGFSDRGIAAFSTVAGSLRALRVLVDRSDVVGRLRGRNRGAKDAAVSDSRRGAVVSAVRSLSTGGRPALSEAEAKRLVVSCGISVPESALVPAGTRAFAPSFSGPFAVKVSVADILHKTEAGGVRLGVGAEDLGMVVTSLQSRFPHADILVERMIPRPDIELILGAVMDPSLGPVLMVGEGGVLAELARDISFRPVPVDRTDARRMLESLRIGELFSGYRGMDIDTPALVDIMVTVSAIVEGLGERFGELDLNPIVFAESHWVALDAKVTFRSK